MADNYFNSRPSYITPSTEGNYQGEALENENLNYVTSRSYNGEGESLFHLDGESRSYFDDFGRIIQNQEKKALNSLEKTSHTTLTRGRETRSIVSYKRIR